MSLLSLILLISKIKVITKNIAKIIIVSFPYMHILETC